MVITPEYKLPAVGAVNAGNAGQKLSEQLAAVVRMNASVSIDEGESYGLAFRQQPSATTLPARLDYWLNELSDNLKAITSHLPDVDSYSLQVGFPWGVSVSVSFSSGSRTTARSASDL